jgi:hypothetical protein
VSYPPKNALRELLHALLLLRGGVLAVHPLGKGLVERLIRLGLDPDYEPVAEHEEIVIARPAGDVVEERLALRNPARQRDVGGTPS